MSTIDDSQSPPTDTSCGVEETKPSCCGDVDGCGEKNGTADGEKSFSPFAGCSIFIIAGLMAAGMITFLIWSYYQERDRIEKFTDEVPKTIQVVDTSDKEVAQVDLKSKLVGLRHNIEAKHSDEMTLNAEELNLAIASFQILKPLRRTFWVTSIENGGIHANISFATKSRMFSDAKRYINASLTIEPELVDGATFPKVTTIHPDNGTSIPPEHQKLISESLLKALYDDKELGPVFRGLSSVEIKNNTLVLHTDPTFTPEEPQQLGSTELVIDRLLKGFAIIAVVFLVIVTIIIILSRRKNAPSSH